MNSRHLSNSFVHVTDLVTLLRSLAVELGEYSILLIESLISTPHIFIQLFDPLLLLLQVRAELKQFIAELTYLFRLVTQLSLLEL